ncbi:MAG: CoA transferase [Hyphomicrobiales bacterium]|nr:CoA transferase [Hyphomicrobiales bacterium]
MTAHSVLSEIWRSIGAPDDLLGDAVLIGSDPVLPSSFKVGLAAQVSIAASALAAADLWRLRSGRRQSVSVDRRHAAIEFRSERYLRVEGKTAPEPWDRIAGIYRCADGGFVRLHTNFPHHRDGILALLKCAYDRDAVAQALMEWNAFTFEKTAADAGLVVAALRSFGEWDEHPQAKALAALPLVAIEKIGEAKAEALPLAKRPLSGVRVLDLTRIIAGPVCGRTLAAHGADVLLVTAGHLPSIEQLVIDTGRGKRSTRLDLRDGAQKETFRGLLSKADILVQGYRPGAIAALGFGPQEAAKLRPGIVYVTLSAYGQAGPWRERRGFDSLVQTASGFNEAEARAAGSDMPKPLPAQALDHATGYLLAFAAMTALARRAREGGSWHVQVSLARTAQWLRSLGRVENGFACPDPTETAVSDLLEETPSGFGRLRAVRHSALLSQTPARWDRPSVPLGSDPPVWEG